jgi:hypothetical protein
MIPSADRAGRWLEFGRGRSIAARGDEPRGFIPPTGDALPASACESTRATPRRLKSAETKSPLQPLESRLDSASGSPILNFFAFNCL